MFATLLSDLGLQTLGIRKIAQEPENTEAIISTCILMKLGLGLVSWVLFAGFAHVSGQSETIQKLILLYGFSLLTTSVLMEWVFTGLQQMGYIGPARVLQQGTYFLVLCLFVHGSRDVLWVPVAYFSGIAASGILLFAVFRRRFPAFKLRFRGVTGLPLLKEALPLGASFLIIQVYINFSVLLLGWIKGETATGYYGGAFRVMLVPLEFLGMLFLALYPMVASRWKHSPESVGLLLEKILKLILCLSLPVAMGGLVLAPPVLVLVLGPKFSKSVIPFQILLWNLAAVGVNGVYGQLALLMNNRQREFFALVTLGAVLSLLLDLTLIPGLSYIGASIAWLATEVVMCLLSAWMARRYVKIVFWPHLLRPLGAAGIMSWAGFELLRHGLPFWWVIPLVAIFYCGALFSLGGITRKDLEFMRQLFQRETVTGYST